MSARDSSAPSLQTLFKRVPSIRERTRRASLGQVSGAVAIHDAVAKGKIHLAKFILDAVEGQLLVDVRDAHGKTPLIRAMRINEPDRRIKVVDLLIGYEANVNLLDNVGRSALSYACELRCNYVIRKLVQNNVDPNLEDRNGNTPLMYCAMADNAEAIEIISRSFRRLGLEVDKVNADGMTPLMEAAKNGHLECARLLAKEAKASVIARDVVRNMNAADWAREGGCTTPEVEVLLPKQRAPLQPTLCKTGSVEKTEKNSTRNGALNFQRENHEDLSHSPNVFLPYSLPGPGLPTDRRHAVPRQHPAGMEELSLKFKELQSESGFRDILANRSSFPEVHKVGRQHTQIEGHPQLLLRSTDLQENSVFLSTPPQSRGGMFIRRPQPPALPRRPCSAAAHRPNRSVNGAVGRASASMEDLLLMGDPVTPSTLNSLKSSSMSHLIDQRSDVCSMTSPLSKKRSINCETHIDLKILPSELSGRQRTASQPLPYTDRGLPTDPYGSVSCTHLPPISPKHDQ